MSSESFVVEVTVPPLNDGLLYRLPPELEHQVFTGSMVEVPLGRRTATGFVINRCSRSEVQPSFEVKPVFRVLTPYPCFDLKTLQFYRWISDYYCVPLSQIIDTAIPPVSPSRTNKHWFITEKGRAAQPRGLKQAEILQFLASSSGPVPHQLLLQHLPHSHQSLKSLLRDEMVSVTENEEDSSLYLDIPQNPSPSQPISLTERQAAATEEITQSLSSQAYASFLLHGITGSGKTEVYIEAALHTLSLGGGILILVPEIALTPQLVDRFRSRLPVPIAVLHSSLPKRKRWECWRALANGTCQVAIGVRSTIFAPMKNLSLIIVDEEHDSSYKQGDGLRYNARDLALVRGSLEKATVVLGSATPSVETFYNASQKKIRYLRLKERPFAGEGTTYEIVDLNKIKRSEMPSENISPLLYREIQETLIRGEQVFLLYNRRGFARYLQCPECGEVVYCPNCSVPLTFHNQGNRLLCHYCSFTSPLVTTCKSCGPKPREHPAPSPMILRGSGTQKILDELQELFPSAIIGRLDRDSAENLDNLESILQQVRSGEIRILAGTQMIAKGHDLPGVTLVGIIDCDVGLHMPDFRAGERIFQLLTQAGGRAGRRTSAGRVILQTRVPTHPSITLTTDKNYHEFAKRELILRQRLRYPPFAKLARVICSSLEREDALRHLQSMSVTIQNWCKENNFSIECLGPTIAPIEKVKALFRAHLVLRAQSSKELRSLIRILKSNLGTPKHLRVVYDIDPQDML